MNNEQLAVIWILIGIMAIFSAIQKPADIVISEEARRRKAELFLKSFNYTPDQISRILATN